MGIWVNEVDYSPLYNAIGSRQRAQTLRERGRNLVGDAIVGIAEAAVDLGKLVYEQARETALAKLKLDVQDYEQQAEQQERDAVLNRTEVYEDVDAGGEGAEQYSPLTEATRSETDQTVPATEATKTIRMPKEYEQWFKNAQKQIQEKYKAFPDLVSWGLDQLYASYDASKERVLGEINKRNVSDLATAEDQLLTGALARSVAESNPIYYETALRNAKTPTPEGRAALERSMKEQYDLGVMKKDVVAKTQTDGIEAGLEDIAKAEEAKTVTAPQAAELREAAAQAEAVANAFYQGKAQTNFKKLMQEGASLDFALRNAGNGTPTAYRPQVDKMLRAAYEEEKRQTDYDADSEMLEWHGTHALDGAGLWKKLHDPEQQYNTRMSTSTFDFWERRAMALMDNGGGSDKEQTPPEVLDKLNDIIMRTDLTVDRKKEEIRKIALTEKVGFDTASDYLGYATQDKFGRQAVKDALERIDAYFKTPEAMKGENPSLVRQQVLSEFARQLEERTKASKGGELDDTVIDQIATSLMKPTKPRTLKIDQAPSNARTTAAARSISDALAGKRNLYDETAKESLKTYIKEKLAYHYGITDEMFKGEGAQPTDEYIPYVWVKGLNPSDPEQLAKLSYRLDEKGSMQAVAQDETGAWIPFPMETVQAKAKREQDAATAASRAASYSASVAGASAADALNKPAPASAGKPAEVVGGTVASISAMAKEKGLSADSIVRQAAGNVGLPMDKRSDLADLLDALGGKNVTKAQVEQFARTLGNARIDWTWAAILDQGFKVVD
jgi:hypothetical protein